MNVIRHAEIPITDLDCAGVDPVDIGRRLRSIEGCLGAYVNPLTEIAYVEYLPAVVQPPAFVAAIESAGYHASLRPGG